MPSCTLPLLDELRTGTCLSANEGERELWVERKRCVAQSVADTLELRLYLYDMLPAALLCHMVLLIRACTVGYR